MAIINAPWLIDTPPAPPRPYGLFDVSLGPMAFPVPASEAGGVIYVPDTCEDDVFLYEMNCPPISGSKTFSVNESPVSGAPFAVITSYTCGSIGYSFEEVEQKVRTRMALREQTAVERRLWQGSRGTDFGVIPGLFQAAQDLGSADCATEGLRRLEQALADADVVGGILHARVGMSAVLSSAHLLTKGAGRQVNTWAGTPIVFGRGYDGSSPAGTTAGGSEYMYASGRVLIWASDVAVPPLRETFDRANNQQMALAERIFAVSVECGVWGISITRDCTTAGT